MTITPQAIATALCDADGTYAEGLDGWLTMSADDGLIRGTFQHDGVGEPPVEWHAVVVLGSVPAPSETGPAAL